MPIRQLELDVAAKIAAGEVVERPASVVKELIENSIDAGATQIRIDLMNGGLQLIRVTDNGSGIPASELPLALARHATSKVARVDDLEHIRSLGFRGEALASIAAVAEVVLLSHQRGASQGAQISSVNGQVSEVGAAACPEGTIVTVRNLFSAVPARLKFLKSRNTEISHCHHLLEQYALAYPEIRFNFFSEGERPVVSGYVSRPTCYKSTRQHLSFFVNRRWVLSRVLTYAVEEAYHSLLLSGRHPIAVVNIQLDPALLDVNVHPAKTEIRFLKERRVYAAVQRAVRSALLQETAIPEWGGKQDSGAPVDHTIPAKDAYGQEEMPQDEGDEDAELAQLLQSFGIAAGEKESQHREIPQDSPWLTVTEEETGARPPILSRLWQSHVRGNEPAEPATTPGEEPVRLPISHTSLQQQVSPQFAAQQDQLIGSSPVPAESPAGEITFTSARPGSMSKLPPLRVLGQLSQSYIVTEGPDGMYLIDQHAAHERILLERMIAALQARASLSQLLLTPVRLEPAPAELEAIEDHMQQLQHIGFDLEMLDDNTLLVKAVPNVLVKQMNARSLHDLLAELTAPEHLGHAETWEEHALANVACKAAIKANYFLTVNEMREMIEQLERTSAPYSCCHGRPTMVHFGLSTLEREFGRR